MLRPNHGLFFMAFYQIVVAICKIRRYGKNLLIKANNALNRTRETLHGFSQFFGRAG